MFGKKKKKGGGPLGIQPPLIHTQSTDTHPTGSLVFLEELPRAQPGLIVAILVAD